MEDAALELEDLTHGERLLLRALRLHGVAASCAGLEAQFDQACGGAGAEACRALKIFVEELRRSARRCIGLRLPAARFVSADEVRLLDVFAAAQLDRYDCVDRELTQMIGEPPSGWLGAAACLVSEAFTFGGLLLRPHGQGADIPARACAQVVPLAARTA